MSLMQPWKALTGLRHWDSVRWSGHPVGQREKMKRNAEMIGLGFGDLSWEDLQVSLFHCLFIHSSARISAVNSAILREGKRFVQNGP